jgi:transcriptional regulator with XRE-family HTH domain
MTTRKVTLNTDKEWLLLNAAEDNNGSVSVGGLAHTLGLRESSHDVDWITQAAFARLVELRRRQQGLTVEALAAKADLELADLMGIEDGTAVTPEPRTVFKLAQALELPPQRLMQLSGLTESRDDGFAKAALRFAARSKPVDQLSKEEHDALAELVKIMCDD